MAPVPRPRSPLSLLAMLAAVGLLLAIGARSSPFAPPRLVEDASPPGPRSEGGAAAPSSAPRGERRATRTEGWCCLRDAPPCVGGHTPRACKAAGGTAFHAEADRCARLCPLGDRGAASSVPGTGEGGGPS